MEQNEKGVITNLFNLNQSHTETSHTLFLDGVISNSIVSLKLHLDPYRLEEIKNSYNYIDLSYPIQSTDLKFNHMPLLLDFGSDTMEDINNILKNSFLLLHKFSIAEIISAASFYPLQILNQNPKIEIGNNCGLHLWKGVSLLTGRITEKVRVSQILL